jgi:ABC-type sugar transport system ATPase subunit
VDVVRPVLSMRHVTKRFFGTTVLDDVSLECRPGEVHAVVGENGAGKSTLMKIIGGAHQADAGTMELDGRPVRFRHPHDALDHGISVIHQEFTLLPERTVAENVFLGREPRRRLVVDRRAMAGQTARLLAELSLGSISPDAPVRRLTVAQQQGVEIAKALSHRPRILVMDEPTAALTPAETSALFTRMRALVARGLTVLYISHRLAEVFDFAQRVTVLKDGRWVATRDTADLTPDELVHLMVGRSGLDRPHRGTGGARGPVRLAVRGASGPGLDGVDLELHRGEIVAVAGLDGSGRAELARALAGAHPLRAGTVEVDGRARRLRSPRAAIRAGIAHVTADRKAEGLVLPLPTAANALLAVRAFGRRRMPEGPGLLPELAGRVGLPATALERDVRLLSGGNQQKVVLAKWLATRAGVYLCDEPTRGVDVGAKATIHRLLRQLADDGAAILVASSDLAEIIAVADRIVVMRHGRIAGVLPAGAREEEIMLLAAGAATAPTPAPAAERLVLGAPL